VTAPEPKTYNRDALTPSVSPTRRRFLKNSASIAAGSALAACSTPEPEQPTARPWWSPKVSENVGDLNGDTLTWMAQLGLEWVCLQGTDWVDREGKGYWSPEDIELLQKRCDDHGLKLYSLMIPLDWLMSSMLDGASKAEDQENIRRTVRTAGSAGVQMIEWRWSPDFKWGDDVGYYSVEGRGGATYKAFDYSRVAGKAPFEELGEIDRKTLFDRLVEFAKPVCGVAEEVGVKMSLHPKDPPVKSMRGIDRILTDTDAIEEFLDAVDSPANGFTFCQGTVTEMGVDVIDAIRRIGGRNKIHHVHFRAVKGKVPQYVETFIDEGDVDMLQAMRAYREVNYTGSLVSDHTPRVIGEISGSRIGRTYSHGWIRGLIEAVNKEA